MTSGPLLHLALVHYPVLNKNGEEVAAAVTNLDIHDIARAAETFGVKKYWLVTPVAEQKELARRIIAHWTKGYGGQYNPHRRKALAGVGLVDTLAEAKDQIHEACGTAPVMIGTSAKRFSDMAPIGFSALREQLQTGGRPHLLVLGTAWGLAPAALAQMDVMLEPIQGTGQYNHLTGQYNHLSVRSAAAIFLARLLG